MSSYGGVKFLRDMPQDTSLSNAVALPPERQVLFDKIQVTAGIKGGCFDVMAWQGDLVLFLEAKRRGHDRLRDSQRRCDEKASFDRTYHRRTNDRGVGVLGHEARLGSVWHERAERNNRLRSSTFFHLG